ncbi:MAG TPA: AraC family transcriptional regulator [Dongiaceae bacterium]|nr:AraC family transcriptional regulator [Dongiaceae bacterium]
MSPTIDVASLLYLWTERTLYIGPLFDQYTRTPAASSLVIGMEGPLRIRDVASADFVETRSVLIPAGVTIEVLSGDQVITCCYLDPLGRDLWALQTLMQRQVGRLWCDSAQEAHQIQQLHTIYQQRLPAAHAYRLLLQEIFPPASTYATAPPVRSQIAEVVEMIRRDPVSNPSNFQLALKVGMSETQLQRQFKQATGIPIRRYRLWHRLFVTATLVMLGKTLTDAALDAGFSDSSHFNRAFRSMLGMTPSFVFQRRDKIFIFAGGDDPSLS